MRLKLKNDDKIKIRLFGSLFVFLCSFVFLYCLPLTVHAETKNAFPLPYGPGSNWGFSNPNEVRLPNDDEILDLVSQVETSTGNTVYGFFIYEIANDFSYVRFAVAFNDFWYLMPNDTYPSMPYNDYMYLRTLNTGNPFSTQIWKLDNNGAFYYDNGNINSGTGTFFSGGVSSSDTFYTWYPFWHKDFEPIQVSSNWSTGREGFVYQGVSGGGGFDGPGFQGSASGQLTPKSSVDGQGFDIDFDFFVDMNPLQILGEEIRDGIGTLIEKVKDGFSIVIGSIGDTFQMLKDNTDTIVSKIQELAEDAKKPSSQQLEEALYDSTVVGGIVDVAQSGKNFLDSLTASGIQVPSSEDMDFDYSFTWKEYKPKLHAFRTHSSTVHISFSWYESIRSKVLLVLGVFMTIGFTVYLIKQMPNLIAGVSGGGSAGVSISDFNRNNSKGAKK